MAERRIRSASARARAQARVQDGKRTTYTGAYGREDDTTELVERTAFPPGVEPAFVRVNAGGTYNLGNYESLRLDVSVTLPCAPEDIDSAYERASQFVAEKLNAEELEWLPKSRG